MKYLHRRSYHRAHIRVARVEHRVDWAGKVGGWWHEGVGDTEWRAGKRKQTEHTHTTQNIDV